MRERRGSSEDVGRASGHGGSEASTPGKRTLTSAIQLREDPAASQAPTTPASSGAGGALPGAVQAKMESAFNFNFSQVRVHEGPEPQALGAAAYTHGTDLHFAPGQYDPSSQRGQELIGHELAHVVQQSEGRVGTTTQFKGLDGNDDAGLEHEADAWGSRAARGEAVGRSSGGSSATGGAVQRKVVQRSPQTSHFGRFLDTAYIEHPRGVAMTLEFEPGTEVDATKIGLTQSVKVVSSGTPLVMDPQTAARQVPSGAGAGFEIDRIGGRNNPIYGSPQLGGTQGLSDTPESAAPSGSTPTLGTNTNFILGHRSPSVGGGAAVNAKLQDRPGRAPAPNTGMEFETTALAIEGSQQGSYYGSVKWGWTVDGSGTLAKIPFALVSQGTPSQNFLAAAAQWNAVTAGGTVKARNSPTQVYSRSGAAFAASFTIAQNTVVVINGTTSIPTSATSYMSITVQGGPANGRSGFIPAPDLVDQGDGPATADLPVPDVHALNTAQTLNDGVDGPLRYHTALPVGTRVVQDGSSAGTAPRTKVWVRVVDGPNTGHLGWIDRTAMTDERP